MIHHSLIYYQVDCSVAGESRSARRASYERQKRHCDGEKEQHTKGMCGGDEQGCNQEKPQGEQGKEIRRGRKPWKWRSGGRISFQPANFQFQLSTFQLSNFASFRAFRHPEPNASRTTFCSLPQHLDVLLFAPGGSAPIPQQRRGGVRRAPKIKFFLSMHDIRLY